MALSYLQSLIAKKKAMDGDKLLEYPKQKIAQPLVTDSFSGPKSIKKGTHIRRVPESPADSTLNDRDSVVSADFSHAKAHEAKHSPLKGKFVTEAIQKGCHRTIHLVKSAPKNSFADTIMIKQL